jgi:hypothetical protein
MIPELLAQAFTKVAASKHGGAPSHCSPATREAYSALTPELRVLTTRARYAAAIQLAIYLYGAWPAVEFAFECRFECCSEYLPWQRIQADAMDHDTLFLSPVEANDAQTETL